MWGPWAWGILGNTGAIMSHWSYVLAAYALAAAVLLGYWRRVERRLRDHEARAGEPRQA